MSVATVSEMLALIRKGDEQITAVLAAFGAPGDYGYETREGKALFALYRFQAELRAALQHFPEIEVPR